MPILQERKMAGKSHQNVTWNNPNNNVVRAEGDGPGHDDESSGCGYGKDNQLNPQYAFQFETQ